MKKTLIIIIIILKIIAITACSDKENNIYKEEDIIPLDVSIIQLISNPIEYHEKYIRVIGIGNLEFEGNSVYLCKDSWFNFVSKNALWLSIGGEIIDDELWYYINGELISEEDAQKYNGKYVLIEGTFDMNITGHRGLYSGGIYNINRFDFWHFHRDMFNDPENPYYTGNVDD